MADIITVLRIETEDGRGPFSRPAYAEAMNETVGDPHADWHDDLPSSLDMFPGAPATMVCGCASPRELLRWFPIGMRDALAEYGFGLSVYELPADAVLHTLGAVQVMFDPARGTRRHRPFTGRDPRATLRMQRRDAQSWGVCPAPAVLFTI